MILEGHGGEIFLAKFQPKGNHRELIGFNNQISLWNFHGECENVGKMTGHSSAVMEVDFFPDGVNIYSYSDLYPDSTVEGTFVKSRSGARL